MALCLVPSALVAAWCVAVNLPGYRSAHERRVAQRVGWDARLQEASSPRPGLLLYTGLELADPQSGRLLARAPFVEIDSSSDRTTVRLPHPAVANGLRLEAFFKLAERLLNSMDRREIDFQCQNVTLHLSDGDKTLTNLSGTLRHDDSESRLVVKFRLATAGKQDAAPSQSAAAEITIVRQRGSSEHTTFEFTTGGTPLPCNLIAASWPGARRLGKTSTFDGRIMAHEQTGVWNLQLAGRFGQIDLQQLVAPFPHKLTGTAEVELKQATVHDGRIDKALGKLVAGPGTISRSLIHAACDNLGLEASRPAASGRDNRLAYRQLNLAFEIDETGLIVRGEFPQAKSAVLVDDKQVLVRNLTATRQPAVNLLRTLVPASAVQVPATRETSGLAALLPVPPVVPPPGSEQPLPQANALRLAPPR